MKYRKPEVEVLGDASALIQGSKGILLDNGVNPGDNAEEVRD